MRKQFLPVVLSLLFCFALFDRQSVFAGCRSLSALIHNGSYAVAGHDGQIVSSCNENASFVPASIIKIPLALAALDILGADFRFTTEFYVDDLENLYVKGSGDPFLISEEIGLVLERLAERGVHVINRIFIDNSSVKIDEQVPGRGKSNNPYDVPVSSVAVNFNTVHFRVHENGRVESSEPQTPTIPIMRELGKGLKTGEYRFNICQGSCSPELQSARYAAELIRSLQQQHGLTGTGGFELRKVPDDAALVYEHLNSRTLEQVLAALLKYSNNFIANQVFLRCGVQRYGLPASWEKARKAVAGSLTRQLGQDIAQKVYLEEGSGLSRMNRTSASAMIKVLEKFKPYAHLLQGKKNGSVKSGTLNGVFNYAGYLAETKSFVILLNQEKNTRDEVLRQLRKNQ